MPELEFRAPGPGSWELESNHMSRPLSRFMTENFPSAFTQGMTDGNRHYGSLLSTMEFQPVNGFAYMCRRAVGAPKEPKGAPPKFVFKLLTKLHPEMRRRLKRTREAFEKKIWRDDLARWDNEWKPATRARALALQNTDPKELSNEELLRHLETSSTLLSDTIRQHHRLNPCYGAPLGDFLFQASEWTSVSASELMQLFRGASKVSLGAADEFQSLVGAVNGSDEAKKVLGSSNPASEILEALLDGSSGAAQPLRAYLDVTGYRVVVGYDVADQYALELPDMIVKTINSSLDSRYQDGNAETQADLTARIRDSVPDQRRRQFDELLEEARLTFRVRDERVLEGDAWATGLTRRALLAVGERLTQSDKIGQPDHAVDITQNEITALLLDRAGPSKQEIAERVDYRETAKIDDAPPLLGPSPPPPPPIEWLPPHGQRAMKGLMAVLDHMFVSTDDSTQENLVTGIPVSPGQYEGTARLVMSAADFGRIQKGDVLVARITAPAYGIVLPQVGAIVTDRGGLLSHPALVAREYGLPAVVGTSDATKKIADGARVLVDGTKGEVKIL